MSGPARSRRAAALVLLALPALAACATQGGSPEGVSVRHLADKPVFAQMAADDHCRAFGRKAVLVKSSPAAGDPSYLFLSTRTSTFECRAP